MKPLKIALYLSLAIAVFFLAERLYYHYTGDFRLANISYENTAYQPQTSQPSLSKEDKLNLCPILNQSYTFLGKGNQSYAFVSQDGLYVLKFFKFGHIKRSWFLNAKSQEKRFLKVFAGYQLAYDLDRENTGLLYIHVNKTQGLATVVSLKDKVGFTHAIDLDQVVFVLQKKMTPTNELFTQLLKSGNLTAVKKRISQLFSLYHSEYKKGIYDRDHNLMYNTGFTDNQALRLDVGKLRQDDQMKQPEVYKKDLQKVAFKRIHGWFKKYYPQNLEEITHFMQTEIERYNE